MAKHCLVTIVVGLFIILTSAISYSSIIYLKTGDKVEGIFIGASKDKIKFKVASQIIRININEISHIVFDKNFSDQLQTSGEDSYQTSKSKVLRALNSIKSVIEVGINYSNYCKRVLDAKVIVDDFLIAHKNSRNAGFNDHISDAIGYYSAVIPAWSLKFKNEFLEKRLAAVSVLNNEYVKKCTTLQDRLDAEKKKSLKNKKSFYPSAIIIVHGIQDLWGCAGNSLSKVK